MLLFVRRKTAYEVRISDWSSDVCSSDLYKGLELLLEGGALVGGDSTLVVAAGGPHPRLVAAGDRYGDELQARFAGPAARFTGWVDEADVARWFAARSEERPVGNEGVSSRRSWR